MLTLKVTMVLLLNHYCGSLACRVEKADKLLLRIYFEQSLAYALYDTW